MDYRFRAEQDWNSKKSNSTYRDDRTRLRYRLRAGVKYFHNFYTIGARIRTGDPRKQQDPQLTLGKGLQEFGTLPIGFEKIYLGFNKNNFKLSIGKDKYPFRKNNELFWSDNVFPEGITLDKTFSLEKGLLNTISLVGGHYILRANNKSFLDDAYFQGFQTNLHSNNGRFQLSSSLFLLRNIPDVPDGGHTFLVQYSILHFGTKVHFRNLIFDFDYYYNLEDYENNSNIPRKFSNQRKGYTIGIQYGDIKTAKKCMFKMTYANLERYAILDYMAQNDWARWDYSSSDSPDGRLSNLKGIEAVVAYSISEKINVVSKYYIVEQLIPYDVAKENGQRIRFDINVKM